MPDLENPLDLGDAGRAFYAEVTAKYELNVDELRILAAAAKTLDELAALEAMVKEHGVVAKGSRGQLRVSPAIEAIREHRALFLRLVGALALPQDDGSTLATGTVSRARRAAEARWRNHRAAKATARAHFGTA
ncbi:hypothetical protein TH66_13050 [Carbonactinospora thermoautotrophica]|uniref:Terminase small subunit n=1 Tax=Carbonactinospora thermoautotrophica TaxID=1469144 RepID=A0A132NDI4_9ACTN|nr:hypothetical protein [Carbonactinospora thermoautotrophica]KWX03720.1 hypothetical protein TH66_13050 [Carbonactinospora thermoautotrophica]KWX08178.1 hypothetical protein TR74_16115 [Carbonactinospora thermoautotrophica]